MDDCGNRLLLVAAGDRDGPLRDPVEEVHGAVERIDDPFEAGRADGSRALLADQGVARPLLAQEADDQRLGIAVGVRDRIGLGALVIDPGGRAVVALDEQRAGRVGGPHGEFEQGVRIGGGQEVARAGLEPATPRFSAECSTS